jgi:transposase-like protein
MCKQTRLTEFKSIVQLVTYFKDEKTCLRFIEDNRWKDGIKCVHCGMDKIHRFKDGKRFECASCKERFTVKVGTIFQNSKLPLIKWFIAMYYLGGHNKGISSYDLAEDIHVTQGTAWYMMQRIRNAFRAAQGTELIDGVIECDESFVGGKNKNRHIDKKVKNSQGRSFKDKTPVMGMLQRNGKLRAVVIADTSRASIHRALFQNVKIGSTIYSDEWLGYRGLSVCYDHSIVDHNKKQFRNGDVCTNAVENTWSGLKRSIIGRYHKVSKKHLQAYVDEVVFRYNNRDLSSGDRLQCLMGFMENPLPYKKLVYGKAEKTQQHNIH